MLERMRRGSRWCLALLGLVVVFVAGFAGEASAAQVASTTKVACPQKVIRVGNTVSCVATVTGSRLPTGTATFTGTGAFSPTSCTLASIGGHQARCSVSYAPSMAGMLQVSASYSGEANNQASSDSTTINVQPGPSSTSVACTPFATIGGAASCSAFVSGTPSELPSGTVAFASNSYGNFDGQKTETCTLVDGGVDSQGNRRGECSVHYLPTVVGTGTHTIYADYSGDSQFLPSRGRTTVAVSFGD